MKQFVFVLILCCCQFVSAQMTDTRFFFASKQCRDSVSLKMKQQVEKTIHQPFNKDTYNSWMGAFWAMELMLLKPADYAAILPRQIKELPTLDQDMQRSFFEMLYTLYPGEFNNEVKSVWQELRTDKVKAMALEYLALSNIVVDVNADSSFSSSVYVQSFVYVRKKSSYPLPSKKRFLDHSFLKGQTVLCSFQSTDRNIPGYLMIRTPDGRWLTDANGNEYRFPQLARAISNLPFYLTNGNTPQGLYRINGFDTSSNNWIGPTTNLQMCLPFEESTAPFFMYDTAYEAEYQHLLGSGLSSYQTLWESFTAGSLGRSEIIAHGTAIDPDFYNSKSYYPATPSLGCLSSPEIWSKDGELLLSVQQDWINLVRQMSPMPKYLIVADIADFL